MVIILQQTLEGGQRFVSTVVEGAHSIEETSFISNFSISSQHSISERSAVYKQRIDSLFGKATRVHNPFIPQNVEPLSIRINGSCVTPTALASPGTILEEIESPVGTIVTSSERLEDEDAYSRVTDRGSVITDSLNHKTRSTSVVNSSGNHNNVSSIRITCDEEESETPQPQSFTVTSSTTSSSSPSLEVKNDKKLYQLFRDIPGGRGGGQSTNNIMWRNGSYGDTSPVLSEEKSFGAVRSSPGGMLQFPVEYLGSVPVEGNTTSLQDLQGPLRKLYLAFLSGKNVMSGQLAITSDGLRFEAPKIRLVNPFTTIAVWAAIKFVARGEPIPSECAFMPLISDPEGQDKSRLFGRMDAELTKMYLGCMTGSKKNSFRNPPIFACVMREASFSLDCHAFACKCAEDAIVVAANLYQSLVDKMRCGNKEGESGYGSLNRTSPSATNSSPNQNRSGSSASSTGVPNECGGGSGANNNGNLSSSSGSGGIGGASGPSSSSGLDDKRDNRVVFSDSESVVPIRPPRRKKRPSEIPSGNLKRYNSDDSILLKMPSRRRSFRGNHYPGKVKKRVQISTPDETSSDSVNESIDQVLDRIVNPGGMSFNDLKPSYQELILKIALTLTQDQLYQKSKQAMKKQQQFHMRKKNSKHANSSGGDASDDNSQFLNQILKSFSTITSSKTGATKKQLSKSISSGGLGGPHKPTCYPLPPPKKQILKKPKEPTEDPFMSFCSGCMCEKCSEKCYCSLPSKHNVKINGVIPLPTTVSVNAAAVCCVTPTIPGQVLGGTSCGGDKPRKLCGYDTDSCAESEKCYCSLQRVKSNGLKIYNINLDTETSDTDTNSYDLEPFNQPHDVSSSSNAKTVSARSVEILSYHPSKKSANGNSSSPSFQTTNAMVHFDNALEDCESLEQLPPRPCTSRSHSSSGYKGEASVEVTGKGAKDKVLLVTGSNPRLVFKEPHTYHSRMDHHQEGKRGRGGKHRHLLDIIEDECNDDDEEGQDGNEAEAEDDEDGIAPEKVLSMKKTAEIAAMFTDLKLEQTTNVIPDLTQSNFDSIQNTEDSAASLDFEASLGYLP